MPNRIRLEKELLEPVNKGPRWKRLLDLAWVILFLPLWLPLFLLIGLLIRLVSKGPILFRQERVGFLGSKFTCLKFRTMFVGNDAVIHQQHLQRLMDSGLPMVKMDAVGDPRIIPFGRMLRASGLDELPQFINIIRGEMSLVGPRPCLPYEFEQYLPWQKERINALPGLTGLWQVNGKNKRTFKEMIDLDIRYARNQSPIQDLAIIAKTIPTLIGQVLEAGKKTRTLLRLTQPQPMISAPSLSLKFPHPQGSTTAKNRIAPTMQAPLLTDAA
jgi:exopolysaccharide production protein ExoY